MNVQSNINKLLFALNTLPEKVRKQEFKVQILKRYDEEKGRVLTSYSVFNTHPNKDGIGFGTPYGLLEFLADKYKELRSG
jgi:hypothetical protein